MCGDNRDNRDYIVDNNRCMNSGYCPSLVRMCTKRRPTQWTVARVCTRRAYGKAGIGNEMETGKGNLKQRTDQSHLQCFSWTHG